jgi:hypothetical protein
METLHELELKALDAAAHCKKRARAEEAQGDRFIEAAAIYRFLIEEREQVIGLSRLVADGKQHVLRFAERRTE